MHASTCTPRAAPPRAARTGWSSGSLRRISTLHPKRWEHEHPSREDGMLLLLAMIAAAAPAPAVATDGARVTAAHAGAVLLGMRLGAAVLWPSDYGLSALRNAPSNLRAAWTRPPELRSGRPLLESDGDPWPVNVFGHGVFGSEIYLRARQCGSGPAGAFAWAAGASVAWEYGLEATAK